MLKEMKAWDASHRKLGVINIPYRKLTSTCTCEISFKADTCRKGPCAPNRALAAAPMAMAMLTGSAVPRGKTWVISSRVVYALHLSSKPKEAWLKSISQSSRYPKAEGGPIGLNTPCRIQVLASRSHMELQSCTSRISSKRIVACLYPDQDSFGSHAGFHAGQIQQSLVVSSASASIEPFCRHACTAASHVTHDMLQIGGQKFSGISK